MSYRLRPVNRPLSRSSAPSPRPILGPTLDALVGSPIDRAINDDLIAFSRSLEFSETKLSSRNEIHIVDSDIVIMVIIFSEFSIVKTFVKVAAQKKAPVNPEPLFPLRQGLIKRALSSSKVDHFHCFWMFPSKSIVIYGVASPSPDRD